MGGIGKEREATGDGGGRREREVERYGIATFGSYRGKKEASEKPLACDQSSLETPCYLI